MRTRPTLSTSPLSEHADAVGTVGESMGVLSPLAPFLTPPPPPAREKLLASLHRRHANTHTERTEKLWRATASPLPATLPLNQPMRLRGLGAESSCERMGVLNDMKNGQKRMRATVAFCLAHMINIICNTYGCRSKSTLLSPTMPTTHLLASIN